MSSSTGSDAVYLFGLVSTGDGRGYKVFSLRVDPQLPLLRFCILLAEHLGVVHPDRLDIWRLDENVNDNDKRLLHAHQDPATQFRLTELPRAFQTVGSWLPSIEENTLHILVRLPEDADASSANHFEWSDALPPSYTHARRDPPYRGGDVNAGPGMEKVLAGSEEMTTPDTHNSASGLPVAPRRTVSGAPPTTSFQYPAATSPAEEPATYNSLMDHLTAEASAKRANAEASVFAIRINDEPDASRKAELPSHFKRKKVIWFAGALILLVIGGVAAGVVLSRHSSSTPTPSPPVTPAPAPPSPSPLPAPNSTVPIVARKEWVMLPGYDVTVGRDLASSSIPQANMSLRGTTCGEASTCVASIWNSGTCYLKSTIENFVANPYVFAFFERNTSYTGWQQTAGQSVLASDFASYNATLEECGSTCVTYPLCRGFEMFGTPTATNAACVLKLLGTGPGLSPKPGATFWAKP
ncbi:hypothetical protein HDU87_001260 [Geranomyces variabilis]|uniref:Uncharacterized protein n=1 Tax=Geranomyces variabilis TaxID=109894 RepID=A0AAD5XLD5_9FUNG|nr:hypothetical protein HDU87_001260 [Geranomyces variabilis]